MKKITKGIIFLSAFALSNTLFSQIVKVKSLPESSMPTEHTNLHTVVRNENNTYTMFWTKSPNLVLEEGSMIMTNVDSTLKKLNQKTIVNTSTPDDKRFSIGRIFKNSSYILLNPVAVGSLAGKVHMRGIPVDESGKSNDQTVEYINIPNKNSSLSAGLYAHHIFSPNGQYYACYYSSYSRAVGVDAKAVWFSVYNNKNNKLYSKEEFKVAEFVVGHDMTLTNFALTNEGELYFVTNIEGEKNITTLLIDHISKTGEVLSAKKLEFKTNCIRDYNITTRGNDLIISGITQETLQSSNENHHKQQNLDKFFYAEFSGEKNDIEKFLETKYDVHNALMNEEDGLKAISQGCLKIRDIYPNGNNTWVVGEIMHGLAGAFGISVYSYYREIVVFNLDATGKLVSINKIMRRNAPANDFQIYSTLYDDIFKSYRSVVSDNKLYIFYNLFKQTGAETTYNNMKVSYNDHLNPEVGGYVSSIDNEGRITNAKSSATFNEGINFRTFAKISNNKVMFQLGPSKKVVEVTLQ